MIYVTGDMHGDIDRFKVREIKKLKANDVLIVCGDFGFLWFNDKKEQNNIKAIGKRKHKTLFIEGTHDNYDLISKHEVVPLFGSFARHISGNLYSLIRGNIYNIDNNMIFAMGGAETEEVPEDSSDAIWFKEEMPTLEELEEIYYRLKKHDFKLDYIITHDAPGSIKRTIDVDSNYINHLHTFFDDVSKSCKFKKWYLGRYHKDKAITKRHTLVFRDIIRLGE